MPYEKSLKEIPLFRFIDKSLTSHLNECSTIVTKKQSQAFLLQGEPVPGLYVIVKGEAEVFLTTRRLPICTFGPGDAFGEMSLLDNEKSSATIRAKSAETSCIFINGKLFSQKLLEIPQLATSFYKGASLTLSSRLRIVNTKLRTEIEALSIDGNIASFFHLKEIDHALMRAINELQNVDATFTDVLRSSSNDFETNSPLTKLEALLNEAKQILSSLLKAYP